jgi:hypothetical protein
MAATAAIPAPAPAIAQSAKPEEKSASLPAVAHASAPASQISVVEFVSENEVRAAIAQREKIYVGPKTIITPSARDLGDAREVFVVTDIVPAPSKKPRREA